MSLEVSTENYITRYQALSKNLILIEKEQVVDGTKQVIDVFSDCWALGYSQCNTELNISWENQSISTCGQGLIIVPAKSLVEWNLTGNQVFSFKAILSCLPWPEDCEKVLSVVDNGDFLKENENLIKGLFESAPHTSTVDFSERFVGLAAQVVDCGRKLDPPHKALAYQIRMSVDSSIGTQATLDQIAEELHISKSYLIRVFKRFYKLTPGQYMQRLKIYNSMYQMLFHKTNTTVAAFEAGFESLGHYYKYFRSKIGVTPGSYKKNDGDKKNEL